MKELGKKSKLAFRKMANASSEKKNLALEAIAACLEADAESIIQANLRDIVLAEKEGLNSALIDRLSLQQHRLEAVIRDLRQVLLLKDPIGERFDEEQLPNQLSLVKQRTPLGVLGIIYESRPNVTVDVSALAIKSGNCAILRGGKETVHTNEALLHAIQRGLEQADLPKEVIQLVPGQDRSLVKELLRLHEYVDLIIPRGSNTLQEFCRENSTIPVITGGIGICHLFVDKTADQRRSLEVIVNAKTQRPTVCNALDTLLVHQAIAQRFIPQVIEALQQRGVSFRLDPMAWEMVKSHSFPYCIEACPEDWNTEWLSLVLGIKVVADLQGAIEHIHTHSSGHSDGILTDDPENAACFVREVDSAAVYVNASTRFTDGGQLGLGSEVAISTQKLHARGPMGLKELTSYKWVVTGDYRVRES